MEYFWILVFAVILLIVGIIMISLNALLGPRDPQLYEDYPYECGVPLYDKDAQTTFHQGYYLLGLLLLLFDIEAAFLFPWTVVYRYLGIFGFIEMLIFIIILTYGLLYAWAKGALNWQFEIEEL